MRRLAALVLLLALAAAGSTPLRARTPDAPPADLPLPRAEADRCAGELLNAGRSVELARRYDALRDSLSPLLRELAGTVAYAAQGRFAESNAAFGRLCAAHADEAGEETLHTLRGLTLYNDMALNDYAAAARTCRAMMARDEASRAALAGFDRWMTALTKWPPTTVERPAETVVIPLEIRRVGRGIHPVVQVEANGRREPFIFDTGCSGANFCTFDAARRMGLRIVADSIPLTGATGQTEYASIGVADTLRIGPVTVLHPTFYIAREMTTVRVKNLCQAVLGTDILRALGEMRIEARRRRIVLPATPSPAPERNLDHAGGAYFLSCRDAEHPAEWLRLQFDTGATESTLSAAYHARHRDRVEAEGKRTQSTHGGFGGIRTERTYVLPRMTFALPERPVTLRRMTVLTDILLEPSPKAKETKGPAASDLPKPSGTGTQEAASGTSDASGIGTDTKAAASGTPDTTAATAEASGPGAAPHEAADTSAPAMPAADTPDGRLGCDLLTACSAVTIDLQRLFVRTE